MKALPKEFRLVNYVFYFSMPSVMARFNGFPNPVISATPANISVHRIIDVNIIRVFIYF
jgi:hypothetical protein